MLKHFSELRLRHLILIIVIIGFTLYLPSLNNHFVWDDEEQVLANQAVHSLSNIRELLTGSTFNSGGGGTPTGLYYKPLMSISFAFIYTIFGAHPWSFHLFQLLLHSGSTILFLFLLNHLTNHRWSSFLTSLVFLMHPLNVETVVYISSLQDTLYMFFGMLALVWVALSSRLLWYDYLLTAILLLLSILGKETGLIFFGLIGLYLLIYNRQFILGYIISATTSLGLYLHLRINVAHIYLSKNYFTPIANLPLPSRLINVPKIAWHYLSGFVWPQALSISEHWIVTDLTLTSFYLPLLFTILIGAFLFWLFRHISKPKLRQAYIFFLVWFLVSFTFHFQIFPLDLTVADRWFYLPIAGLLGLLASSLSSLKTSSFNIVTFIILITLFIRSSIRIADWQDGLTLYGHDIKYTKNSFDLENNYGVELFRAGDYQSAKIHFENSTKIAPNWWINWNNLGAVIENEGDLDLARKYYQRSIDHGHYYLAYGNYARILLKQEKIEEAKVFLIDSLQYFPNSQELKQLYQYSLTR